MQLKPNTELQGGKYRIIRVLGQGGFGITYLAEHTMLDKQVAIKEFFTKEYCGRDETTSHITIGTLNSKELVGQLRNKFIKEAKNISKLHHLNIITIHDIFEENDTAYYVMEYVNGASLSEMIKENGAINESSAIKFIHKIGEAVEYMHSLNMNHLDVKPANIMIRKSDGEPILIDFGLSKQYDASGGQTSTTPIGISHGFAPIEQYRPGGVSTFSPQTDIYALGATLFNLITGNVPPHYSDILEEGLPELPSNISQKIVDAIEHAMEIKRNKRPSSVKQFFDELGLNDNITVYQQNKDSLQDKHTSPVINSNIRPADPPRDMPVNLESLQSNEETVMIGDFNKPKQSIPKALDNESKTIINGIEFVDLGLDVKWANANIGAVHPSDFGTFINKDVSSETTPVFEFNFQNAKIPTIAQWEELRNRCRWEITELDGVGGYMIYGKNGNSIFLPFSADNNEFNFSTFGRLFTRETFYSAKDSNNHYYFYFSGSGTYKCTQYMNNYHCPVRMILDN